MKPYKVVFQITALVLMFFLVMAGHHGWAVVFLVLLLLSAVKVRLGEEVER